MSSENKKDEDKKSDNSIPNKYTVMLAVISVLGTFVKTEINRMDQNDSKDKTTYNEKVLKNRVLANEIRSQLCYESLSEEARARGKRRYMDIFFKDVLKNHFDRDMNDDGTGKRIMFIKDPDAPKEPLKSEPKKLDLTELDFSDMVDSSESNYDPLMESRTLELKK